MKLDVTAINLFLAKDESGALYVYKKTYGLVKSLCYDILRDDSDAEDAAMETYRKVLASPGVFTSDQAFLRYLCVTARCVAIDMAKRKDPLGEENDDAQAVAEGEETKPNDLIDAMRGVLDQEDVDLVVFHLCHGLSFPLCAKIQGGTSSGCRGRYFRAMKKLRESLRKEDYE